MMVLVTFSSSSRASFLRSSLSTPSRLTACLANDCSIESIWARMNGTTGLRATISKVRWALLEVIFSPAVSSSRSAWIWSRMPIEGPNACQLEDMQGRTSTYG